MSERRALYFAYGSNLLTARMTERLPSAEIFAVGWLAGYEVRFNKSGADGTAKANLAMAQDHTVWGTIYRIKAAALPKLDRIEGGYERRTFHVHTADDGLHACHSYISDRLSLEQAPAAWYVQCVIDGAREHGLPLPYIARLQMIAAASTQPRANFEGPGSPAAG